MNKELQTLRRWLIFFMVVLFLSGLTAMPLETELAYLCSQFSTDSLLGTWLYLVYKGISATNRDFPFMPYGYDWLAFAHFVLALLFIGPYKDPVRNKWVIEFGMLACLLIIPFAIVAGHFRGIPIGWRILDCSFGIIGLIPLSICRNKITLLENFKPQTLSYEN